MRKSKKRCALGALEPGVHLYEARQAIREAKTKGSCRARVDLALQAIGHAHLASCGADTDALEVGRILREARSFVDGCSKP